MAFLKHDAHLQQETVTVLNVLSGRVHISGGQDSIRVKSLSVLALALA